MRFTTKLLLTFGVIGLLTNGISITLLYRLSRYYLFEGYRDKMLSIAATTATMLDGELLKAIQKHADASTPEYAQLRQELRDVRNANQRRDTYMKRVFTIMRAKQDPMFG